MKILFSLILIWSSTAHGNYQFYDFDPIKFQVSDSSYRRYIIPQLKSLIKEYYHILEKIDPLQKEVIKIKSQTVKMENVWRKVKVACSEVTQECTSGLREVYHLSRKLDKSLSNYLSEKIKFPKENMLIDSTLKLHGSIDRLFNLNYQNLHAMEEYLITYDTSLFPHNKIHHNLGHNLHQMNLSCEFAMTGKLIPEIQNEFDFIWNHFFKIIENLLNSSLGQKFLLQRLGELNISWNAFSMKMTKGNLKVPANVPKIVKIMHNRWNSILKVILRR